jgi:hypothetical protein
VTCESVSGNEPMTRTSGVCRAHDAFMVFSPAGSAMNVRTRPDAQPKVSTTGLYQATTCLDYPRPFSYDVSPARRKAQFDAAVARLPKQLFAPSTVHEWLTEPPLPAARQRRAPPYSPLRGSFWPAEAASDCREPHPGRTLDVQTRIRRHMWL